MFGERKHEEEEEEEEEEGGRRRKEDAMTSKNLTTLTWQVGKNNIYHRSKCAIQNKLHLSPVLRTPQRCPCRLITSNAHCARLTYGRVTPQQIVIVIVSNIVHILHWVLKEIT